MSEKKANRNLLVVNKTHHPARVQAAGRQLAIAAQLNHDLDRRRLVAILKRASAKGVATVLSQMSGLDGELIERFEDRWEWGPLSLSEALPWSLELFERFEDRWEWGMLSANQALPWSLKLIERFEDRWDWGHGGFDSALPTLTALPWSLRLIERFEDRWEWGMLSANQALPWSLELVERFEDRWEWERLSETKGALCLLILRPSDIIGIMAHHYEERRVELN